MSVPLQNVTLTQTTSSLWDQEVPFLCAEHHAFFHDVGVFLRTDTRFVPSHEQLFFFLHANREQQTKERKVADGTSCCATLECLMKSIACIT